MTDKKHTPSGAKNSTSARTRKQPATPDQPKDKGRGSNGKARKVTPEQEAWIRARVDADAAVAHPLAMEAYTQTFGLYLENAEALKVARRVVAAYDAQSERDGPNRDGCHFFMENYVDPLMTGASDNFMCGSPHDELFTFLFVRAAREYRDDPTPNHWTELLDILARAETEEGFDFGKECEEHERRFAEIGKERKADQLAKPEPKDKLSDEWRYWKLRQIGHAFDNRGNDGDAYNAAHGYFRELLTGLYRDEDFYRVGFILHLLPHLIIARQELDATELADRQSEAATRRTRKAKAAKKGGAE